MIKVRRFILIVDKVKQRSEYSQRFPFNNTEIKQHKACSHRRKKMESKRFLCNSSEIKQRSQCSH